MSMLVAHMEKYNMKQYSGVGRHSLRTNENSNNPNIDRNRTALNYSAMGIENSYTDRIHSLLEEKQVKKKADSVVMVSWVITSDGDFFKSLSDSEQKRFFSVCADWFVKELGGNKGYVLGDMVHLDETTAHMHFDYCPIMEDGKGGYKLCAKDLFNRQFLKKVQRDLPKHLRSQGFNIDRGMEGSTAKNRSVGAYRSDMTKLEKEIERAVANSDKKAIEGIFRRAFAEVDGSGVLGLASKDTAKQAIVDMYNVMQKIFSKQIEKMLRLEKSLAKEKRLNISPKQRIAELEKEITDMKDVSDVLENSLSTAKGKISDLERALAENRKGMQDMTNDRNIYKGMYQEQLRKNKKLRCQLLDKNQKKDNQKTR